MGALPVKWKSTRLFLPPLPLLFLLVLIGIQPRLMSCSGDVSVISSRPYLFRDIRMPAGYSSVASKHAQIVNLYRRQQQPQSMPHYSDSGEAMYDDFGSSSEEEEQQQQAFMAPLILDIDDPNKGRWLELRDDESFEVEDYAEPETGSELSSSEFFARSSPELRSGGKDEDEDDADKDDKDAEAKNDDDDDEDDDDEKKEKKEKSGEKDTKRRSNADEDRGIILDQLKLISNPLMSFWQGTDGSAHSTELPQADESYQPDFYYQPFVYDPSAYYDTTAYDSESELSDQHIPESPKPPKKPKAPKTKKPKAKKAKKPKQKKPKKPKKPKRKKPKKPKRKHKPWPAWPMPMPMPMKVQMMPMMKPKPPKYQYQKYEASATIEKPNTLSQIAEKLAKLNPLRYIPSIEIQKPKITIQNPTPAPAKKPPPVHYYPPPMKRPPPPGMIKYKKQKPKKPKPYSDENENENDPEFMMVYGPQYEDSTTDAVGSEEEEGQEEDQAQADDEMNDEDEEEEEEEDEDEEEDDEDEDNLDTSDIANDAEIGHSVTQYKNEDEDTYEDDEMYDDYPENLPLNVSHAAAGESAEPETRAGQQQDSNASYDDEPNPKEKSLSLREKLFPWRRKKKKRRRRRRRPPPLRKPQNWKEYKPAPLVPEFPEALSDSIMKVIKHVGFLPEYDKIEKYGGHNKIKGKFTKTRPITLHSGLVTSVLRKK